MSEFNAWIKADWPAPAKIHAGTTTRLGGVSKGNYNGLNLATHVKDNPADVEKNRQQLVSGLSLPSEPVWLEQVHSANVVDAAETEKSVPCADASFTTAKNVVCCVMTADCLPLLLTDRDASCVAAIHAGWKGLADGIIENTVQQMPVDAAELMVWLGPAIGPSAYEVGKDVRDAFMAHDSKSASAFEQRDEAHWLMDIYQLARQRLASLGVSEVYGGDFCTFTDSERFYSYRRDNITGRMASLIWIES